jgi:hypothetical protein
MPSTTGRRQRAFGRRSKNGCQTCKNRHLRCDDSIPAWYLPLIPCEFSADLNSNNCSKLGRHCSFEERILKELLATHTSDHNSISMSKPKEASAQQLLSLSLSKGNPNWPDIILRSSSRPSPHLESRIIYTSPIEANLHPRAVTFMHHYQNMVSHALLGPQYGHKIALTEHFPK